MELCNVGQYNVRLRILDSLYFYSNSLNQHENGLLFIIGSIYSYYERFHKQIYDYVQIETVAMAVEATQYQPDPEPRWYPGIGKTIVTYRSGA